MLASMFALVWDLGDDPGRVASQPVDFKAASWMAAKRKINRSWCVIRLTVSSAVFCNHRGCEAHFHFEGEP
jgi:hypothetical protein